MNITCELCGERIDISKAPLGDQMAEEELAAKEKAAGASVLCRACGEMLISYARMPQEGRRTTR